MGDNMLYFKDNLKRPLESRLNNLHEEGQADIIKLFPAENPSKEKTGTKTNISSEVPPTNLGWVKGAGVILVTTEEKATNVLSKYTAILVKVIILKRFVRGHKQEAYLWLSSNSTIKYDHPAINEFFTHYSDFISEINNTEIALTESTEIHKKVSSL